MEVSQVLGERARWDRYMPVFANLLRPSAAAGPVTELPVPGGDAINDAITAFRNSDAGASLKIWGDRIVTVVFDGYAEWARYYAAQPEWVLTSLARVLAGPGQQAALLAHLQDIVDALPEARGEYLVSFRYDIDQWAPNWQHSASAEPSGAQGSPAGGQDRAQAYPNTSNWNYSRTPGTFYYRYLERDGAYVYVYSDDADAAGQDWRELKYWDERAEMDARRPENELTTKFPDWDSSWAGWSVLDNPKAEGGRVYGKAGEGRWYDYNGAVAAHGDELRAQARVTQRARAQRPPAEPSPLMALAQEIHEKVLLPLTAQVMRNLPPEITGKEGIDDLVRRCAREDISRRVAALAGQQGE